MLGHDGFDIHVSCLAASTHSQTPATQLTDYATYAMARLQQTPPFIGFSACVSLSLRRIPGAAWLLLGLICASSAAAADWPGWRGPSRDGHSAAGGPAIRGLSAEPRRVWRLKIGDGLAAPVVAGSRVYYLDAQDTKEILVNFSSPVAVNGHL
jgi:hypothetical protein